MKIIEAHSPKETYELGRQLAKAAGKGDLFVLNGELGVGKTVFAQGFAEGLEISEPMNSPTFTILEIHEGGRFPLYHFDVYRIAELEEMDEIGYEEFFYGDGICLVEWGSLIQELLPENSIYITIEKDLARGFDYRRIRVENESGRMEDEITCD